MKVRRNSKNAARKPPNKPAREQLKDWRIGEGLTQIEAAKALNVTPNFIGNLERAERMPGLPLANLVKKVTGIKQEDWGPPATPEADPVVGEGPA